MGQEPSIMVLLFRIKSRKGCTKKCLCTSMKHCISGKTKKQDDTMISKTSGDVVGASKITYALLWQSSNTKN